MKLVIIAIFSVIQLVVCAPQQEALAEDTPGLYYNFDKNYGWNIDSTFDESRYDEVDHNQRADRSRDIKGMLEQGDRDYNREEDQNNNNDRNRQKQRGDRADDRSSFTENYKDDDNDKNERYSKRDKNRDRGNDNVDSNRDDKGRSDKNKDYSREEKNGDKYRKKENVEENTENAERQFNQKKDKQESGKDKNSGNKNYERQNQNDKTGRDDKNIRGFVDKQNKDRGDINYNGNNNYESNYRNDKDRSKEKENRNKDNASYTNEKEIRKYEYDSKNNGENSNKNKGKNNGNKDDRRYQEGITRDDKQDKEQNYNYDKNNEGSNKSRNKGTEDYSHQSENKYSSRRDDKDKDIYVNNQYKKEQQSYSRSRSENYSDNKEKSYNNGSPGYGYSYLESLITAPKPNSDSSNAKLQGSKYKENIGKEQDNEKKKEVIEIHGYISKGNEKNDKQVEVDVIVKKADTVLGKGLDSKGGLHIHKVLNNEVNEKGYRVGEPQSELKYEYIKPGKKTDNKEKDYRELFNNQVQDKKDILGGIEILGLISNIGQEIKEQVIEKIPGYNIIQKLGGLRRQQSENIQEYNYDQGKKYPKIDLEVYYPPKKQYEDGDKKVEDFKSYTELKKQDKEVDVYTRDKKKKEKVSKYMDQDRKVQVIKEIDTFKNTEISERNGNVYKPNKGINLEKEKEIDVRIRTDKGNQVVNIQREGKKDSYDYMIRHKQTGLYENKAQKYMPSNNDGTEKKNSVYQHEEFYNPGNSYKNSEKSGVTKEDYNYQQNELYEPLKVKQIPVNFNRDFSGREYFLQGGNVGTTDQGPGNFRQLDRINSFQDYMNNKQREEKYVYDYTIGNLEKQGPVYNYNMPNSKGQYEKQRDYSNVKVYRPNNMYEYNKNYEPKPNEGWSYQGFTISDQNNRRNLEEKINFPQYEKDKDDQAIVRVGNPYGYKSYEDFRYREEPYINRGYPNYILPNYSYNQGIFGGDFGLSHPYPLPNVVNPLSQQILGSAGRTQEYYHQNYTKNLGNLPRQREYDLRSGESKPAETYPNYEDAYSYYE